jgi:pyruvate/2-oxoglutarate/acetoin dehydrogenase E1 component
MRTITYSEAIREAIDEEMARDPKVFVMGEDIGKFWGGALGELKGLFDKYGAERIRETPISETAILGGAIGAAATGMRPVAWLYFTDFLGVCGDEMINQLTTMRYMFGGKAKVPVTITAYSGAGVSAAAQHSKCVEGLLMSIPGLKIISAGTPYDEKGLLKSAIRDDNPVMVSHHKVLIFTGVKGEVPDGEYTIPLGKADVKREGKDVTIVAWSLMMHRALAAAKKLEAQGVSVEVVDPRTLVPLDKEAILKSVAKTGRLVIVDEEPKMGSAACSVAAVVAEEGFGSLKKPVKLVCAPDTPIPFSPPLEKFWMPSEERIIQAVKEVM